MFHIIKEYFRKILSSRNSYGFIFVEVIIGIAIIGIVFVGFLGIALLLFSTSSSMKKTTKANFLIKESLEAVRVFRDSTDWDVDGLSIVNTGYSNPYYADLDESSNPATWKLVSGTETVDEFTRKIIFDPVSRNPASQNIEYTYNLSNDDPDTIKITVIVENNGNSHQVVTYLTNWQQ